MTLASAKKTSKPPSSLLKPHAPLHLWWEAERQALRSTMRTHRMGAVIFDDNFRILAKGTAHRSERFCRSDRSTHAEEHACAQLAPKRPTKLSCLVVGLSKAGHWIQNSCPCARCAIILNNNALTNVTYAHYLDNEWIIATHDVSDLAQIAQSQDLSLAYAKSLRLITKEPD